MGEPIDREFYNKYGECEACHYEWTTGPYETDICGCRCDYYSNKKPKKITDKFLNEVYNKAMEQLKEMKSKKHGWFINE